MKKAVKFKQVNGVEIDINVKTLSFRERNQVFNEYLNLNQFMKKKDTDEDNILEYIKENKSVLDFMDAILTKGLDININELESSDADKLFQEHSEFIMSGGGVSKN